MKVRLSCIYHDASGQKKGEPGDEIELTPAEAAPLIKGGSAVLVEKLKKSER